jgi:flagellar biosynthesis protein FliR
VRASLELLPPGALLDPLALAGGLSRLTLDTVETGVVLALPVALLLLLVTAFTTVLARVLPKLHVFDFAYALRMMIGLLLVSMLVPRLVPAVGRFGEQVAARLGDALVAH